MGNVGAAVAPDAALASVASAIIMVLGLMVVLLIHKQLSLLQLLLQFLYQ